MKNRIIAILTLLCLTIAVSAQEAKKNVYDETIDPMAQIDKAIAQAKTDGKFVICQVGGNWCPWCLKFADFVTTQEKIKKVIDDSFVYIHVNYPRRTTDEAKKALTEKVMARLSHPERFGFPCLVVLNAEGQVIHVQDSSFLEEEEGYNAEKVLRFLNCWTPKACK